MVVTHYRPLTTPVFCVVRTLLPRNRKWTVIRIRTDRPMPSNYELHSLHNDLPSAHLVANALMLPCDKVPMRAHRLEPLYGAPYSPSLPASSPRHRRNPVAPGAEPPASPGPPLPRIPREEAENNGDQGTPPNAPKGGDPKCP